MRAFDCASVLYVPEDECKALVALYNSTNGDGWTDKTNWLDSTTVDDWFGVTVTGGYISQLDLPSNQLSGSIPRQLGSLSSLQFLLLNSNQLSGSIPSELGDLSSLQFLLLNSNQLSGSIPSELGNLSNLTWMDLSSNPPAGTYTQVSAGGAHTYAINNNGTLACWGDNGFGQSTPPSGTFIQISAGWHHSCATKSDGLVLCWGSNLSGQLLAYRTYQPIILR